MTHWWMYLYNRNLYIYYLEQNLYLQYGIISAYRHCKQYVRYIVAVSFIFWGNRVQKKPTACYWQTLSYKAGCKYNSSRVLSKLHLLLRSVMTNMYKISWLPYDCGHDIEYIIVLKSELNSEVCLLMIIIIIAIAVCI